MHSCDFSEPKVCVYTYILITNIKIKYFKYFTLIFTGWTMRFIGTLNAPKQDTKYEMLDPHKHGKFIIRLKLFTICMVYILCNTI